VICPSGGFLTGLSSHFFGFSERYLLPPDQIKSSSLLKNLEIESFCILAGRCWGGAVELDVIF
jgi:hypothetical protein